MYRLLTSWAMAPLSLLAACTAPAGDVAESRSASPQGPAASGVFSSERLSIQVRGSGPDVILLPGLTSSRRIWEPTVAAVPGYRYHLVQLNGFAGAPVRGNASGLVSAEAAEEIVRYIAEAGLQKPALVGHSMGGAIALMAAARHPDAVGKVMVVDMLPFMGMMFGPPGATPETVRVTADQLRDQMAGANGVAWAFVTQQNMGNMVRSENRRALPIQDAQSSDRGVAARALHELITTDLRPELGRITAPVTVLFVRSPSTKLSDAQTEAVFRASYANLPNARLVRIPDAYHFIMFDQPNRFAAEMKSFLK